MEKSELRGNFSLAGMGNQVMDSGFTLFCDDRVDQVPGCDVKISVDHRSYGGLCL